MKTLVYLLKMFIVGSFICLGMVSNAQNVRIAGKVLGDGQQPLREVAVTVVGNPSLGTLTNDEGNYVINVKKGDVLQFVFTGYKTEKRTAEENATINLVMSMEDNILDDVVVVGYGTQKRSKLTGSVSKLDNQVLETGMRSNPAQALAGTIPGVRVSTGSGRPGSLPSIILRGGTNFDGSGSPLILVDGQVRGSLSDINSEEIASMEVLKDASATAIYGARASNGVILITTKQGKVGRSSINLNIKRGYNFLNVPYNFLSAEDYIKWARLSVVEAIKNGTIAASSLSSVGPRSTGNLYFDANGNPLDGNYDNRARWSTMRLTDQNRFLLNEGWQTMKDAVPTNAAGNYDPNGTYADLIFQGFDFKKIAFKSPAISEDYNVSMSGGNDRGRYYSNIGYYNENGLTLNTFYKRLNIAFNSDYKIKTWLTSESRFNYAKANWNNQTNLNSEAGYWGRMLSAPPTLRSNSPVTGDLLLGRDATDGNPLVNIDKFIRNNQSDKFTINQSLTAQLIEGLSLRISGILYYDEAHYEAFNKDYRTGLMSYTNPNTGWNRDRSSSASFSRTVDQTYNAVLNYTKDIDLHHFDIMLGSEYYDSYRKGLSASGRLAPTDDFMDLELTQNNTTNFTRGTDSWHERWRMQSQFTRINYDYDNKYLATFTARRDGVSRLAPESRYGIFPAASFGWVASRENFMKSISWINFLKLRASWGKNANIGIGTSNPIGIYEVQGAYPNVNPYNGVTGFLIDPNRLANPTLKWEKSNTTEVGFDLGLWNNMLYIAAGYYNRITSDKLADISLPISSGASSMRTNNGSMRNRGVEMDVTARIIQKQDLKWTISANAAWNKNKIIKLPYNGNENNRQGGQQIYDPSTGKLIWVGGLQENQEWGEMFGFVPKGIIRTQEDLLSYNKIDRAANVAYDFGGAAGRPVASQKLITEKGLTGYIATQLGDMMWEDLDKNDTIDFRDMRSLGRILPRWTGGLNTSLSYKGFTLFSRIDFAAGHIQRDFIQGWSLGAMQGEFNPSDIVKQTWTPENPEAKYPRYVWADQLNTKNFDRPSNIFWVNSSYIAFREVSLSYSFPKAWVNKAKMEAVTLSATGQNLGYLTNSMINLPERTGAQNSAYTIPTSFILGLNITF